MSTAIIMTLEEHYEFKRRNFIEKTQRLFAFLTEEFGYDRPVHQESMQANGTVLSDKLIYTNEGVNRQVEIVNAYHPIDYGFEVNLYRTFGSTNNRDRSMVFCLLKEDQTPEQSYLDSVARAFREKFAPQIKGEQWMDS